MLPSLVPRFRRSLSVYSHEPGGLFPLAIHPTLPYLSVAAKALQSHHRSAPCRQASKPSRGPVALKRGSLGRSARACPRRS
ncbi:unnamed protein product [Periconia digitata]|uniref:Uncharacterized protein n=1 Tax=Periconia digitata TaxID=1303443 RepID=A0A9W4XFN5_9PLEO|nr:unnamed protein product [Periconia digitata]